MIDLINVDMEASVLGTILANNDIVYKVLDILTEDCFSEGLHKDIYTCIKKLLEEGEKVSAFRLYNRFSAIFKEENKSYLATLASLASPISFKSDIKHLADLGYRRNLKHLCNITLDKINTFDKGGIACAAELITDATKIITGTSSASSIGIVEAMDKLYKQMVSDKPIYMAKTGLRLLDEAMGGGIQKGRVYAFMAAPKCGKTMLATMISNNLNDADHKHVFVCAEMGSNEISQRMLGQKLDVPACAFMTKDKALVVKAGEAIGKLKHNVIFEDVPGVEFDHLKTLIELHVYKNKIEGFILDYYQLVSGCKKGETQAQHLENVANWVHRVCKQHNIWCILLVQTNDEQKVLGSRGLNRACDQGYLIERPLDEQGDPVGSGVALKLRFSRYTKTINLGSVSQPYLEIHKNGTHFEERCW